MRTGRKSSGVSSNNSKYDAITSSEDYKNLGANGKMFIDIAIDRDKLSNSGKKTLSDNDITKLNKNLDFMKFMDSGAITNVYRDGDTVFVETQKHSSTKNISLNQAKTALKSHSDLYFEGMIFNTVRAYYNQHIEPGSTKYAKMMNSIGIQKLVFTK